jgi:hypothetical protein
MGREEALCLCDITLMHRAQDRLCQPHVWDSLSPRVLNVVKHQPYECHAASSSSVSVVLHTTSKCQDSQIGIQWRILLLLLLLHESWRWLKIAKQADWVLTNLQLPKSQSPSKMKKLGVIFLLSFCCSRFHFLLCHFMCFCQW